MRVRNVSVGTAVKLLHVFWPDFVDLDGSVFLAGDTPENTTDPEHGLDRIGMEAFHNHTHMMDLFNHKMPWVSPADENDEDAVGFWDNEHPDFFELCQLGKTIAKMWFQKLKADFPNYDFRVYYTERDNPIVRFHRIRNDEPNWLEEARYPEEIEKETVIVYDTRYEPPKRGRS